MRVLRFFLGLLLLGQATDHAATSPEPESLDAAGFGELIFRDLSLSRPPGQGCVSCHDPSHAFADPRPVSPGAVVGRRGRRNAPSLFYAALIPGRVFEEVRQPNGEEVFAWEGGLFHDGRARDLFDQVQRPFMDPSEMNLPGEAALAKALRSASYAQAFRSWMGEAAWNEDSSLNYHAYRALVEFLKEPGFRPFDSRIDAYLQGDGEALNAQEKRGLVVFRERGRCADCHWLTPSGWGGPILSDFGYDNLGVPSRGAKDPGLGALTGRPEDLGKFRAPSLRNVALTAPYMHNGSIATLREVMEFYNKRNLEPERWGTTDYPETVNREDLGDLKLTDQEVEDLLALMESFTDRGLQSGNGSSFLPAAPSRIRSTSEMRLVFPDYTHRRHVAFPGRPDLETEP